MSPEQNSSQTLYLLILTPLASDADAVVNVFRDADYSIRSSHVDSLETLEEVHHEIDRLDLLIVMGLPEGLSLEALLEVISKQDRDLPVMFVSDYQMPSERLTYLKLGVASVVPSGNMEMLKILALREVEHLNIRRRYRRLCVALGESEKQRRTLLDDKNDAIAYINHGAVRFANTAFLKLLGENRLEDVVEKLLADWVIDSERTALSDLLLDSEKHGEVVSGQQYHLQNADRDDYGGMMSIDLAPTSYEGHFALSVLATRLCDVKRSDNAKTDESGEDVDDETSLFLSRSQLLERLDINTQIAVDEKGHFTLVYLSLEDREKVFSSMSDMSKEYFKEALGKKLLEILSENSFKVSNLGRGDFVLVIEGQEENDIKALCIKIREQMSKEMISSEGEEFSVNFKMGGVTLRDNTCDAKVLLSRAKDASSKVTNIKESPIAFYQARKVQIVSSATQHLVKMLQDAFEKSRLFPVYQPIINFNDSSDVFYDVRFKMVDVRGREHYSLNFRSKLEKEQVWESIDGWLIRAVSKALVLKQKEEGNTRLLIHPGEKSMVSEAFPVWLDEVVRKVDLLPESFIIAVSEQHITQNLDAAKSFFYKLSQFGFKTAINHFGCSVNPLDNVNALDPDFVIIDSSFTSDLLISNQNVKLKTMMEILKDKQKNIMVSNVTTTQGMAELWKQGISYLSGDFIQSPEVSMDYDFNDFS